MTVSSLVIEMLYNVSLILESFSYIWTCDINTGACALHYAARAGNESACQKLLSSGADVCFDNGIRWLNE